MVHGKDVMQGKLFIYKFRPERTALNMYAEYTQLQLNFLALQPWILWPTIRSHTEPTSSMQRVFGVQVYGKVLYFKFIN